MAQLMLDNVNSDVSDKEIKEFLTRYEFPPFDEIQHLPGNGSHPAVLLTFNEVPPEALRILQPRIQNIFWKKSRINVLVISGPFDQMN